MGFFFDKDISAKVLDEKSSRKVLAHDKDLMACHLYFEAGGIGTPHKHPHTQIALILSGRFEFTLGVGYIRSWVRPYEVKQEYGDLIKDTQEKRVNWFGPTKLAVSFVVPIYVKDKKGGAR